MTVSLVRGDAAHLPLPSTSVDLIVTSPPYFALRSYQDGGGHYAGQIGSEATPGEFIDALIACTREWVRVLKPCGSLWVNLGDKYAGNGAQTPALTGKPEVPQVGRRHVGIQPKSLMGLPWRYALRCIDDLGLILRAEVVWSKPNGLPESVTDRVRRSHEQWFHFVVRPRYYAAVDTIREAHNPDTWRESKHAAGRPMASARNGSLPRSATGAYDGPNPLGKLPGSVWSIPSQPLTVPAGLGVDHFAAFPMELPRRIIQGWSPSGICTVCGEGRRPVTDKTLDVRRSGRITDKDAGNSALHFHTWRGAKPVMGASEVTVTGECCACTPYTDHPGSGERYGGVVHSGGAQGPNKNQVKYHIGDNVNGGRTERTGPWREYHEWTPPPTRPAVVLDPFGGTGTTALMADVLGRHGISVDMSADYCRLAAWRTTDPGERARAMQVDKPEAVADGQMQLFA